MIDVKFDVTEARPVDEDHPQWQISDDEEEDNEDSDEEGISSGESDLDD